VSENMMVTWDQGHLRWKVSVGEVYGSPCVQMETHRLFGSGYGVPHSVEIPAEVARQLSLALYEMSLAADGVEEPDE
jgi:hypothetical protein